MRHAPLATGLALGVLLAACGDPRGAAGAITPKQSPDPSKTDRPAPLPPKSGITLDDKTGDVRRTPVEAKVEAKVE